MFVEKEAPPVKRLKADHVLAKFLEAMPVSAVPQSILTTGSDESPPEAMTLK